MRKKKQWTEAKAAAYISYAFYRISAIYPVLPLVQQWRNW